MPFGRKSCEDISKSFQIKASDAIWEEIVRMHFRIKRCLSYGVISLVLCDGDLIELLALSFEISRWGNLGWGGWGNHWRDTGWTKANEIHHLVFKILSKNPLDKSS